MTYSTLCCLYSYNKETNGLTNNKHPSTPTRFVLSPSDSLSSSLYLLFPSHFLHLFLFLFLSSLFFPNVPLLIPLSCYLFFKSSERLISERTKKKYFFVLSSIFFLLFPSLYSVFSFLFIYFFFLFSSHYISFVDSSFLRSLLFFLSFFFFFFLSFSHLFSILSLTFPTFLLSSSNQPFSFS
ncbi:unnamed protein product [Acanthosepion pharaonis]|uniref:Uncharacterized protein n=1 Tax=Acanthosepion pharaonis TaxID=158019 RepID=A0A812BMU3_ACAPH|nr:unnamed protein product [Sepia pharaonis]